MVKFITILKQAKEVKKISRINIGRKRALIGCVLLVLGSVLLFSFVTTAHVSGYWWYEPSKWDPALEEYMFPIYIITGIILPLILMIGGVYLILYTKKMLKRV